MLVAGGLRFKYVFDRHFIKDSIAKVQLDSMKNLISMSNHPELSIINPCLYFNKDDSMYCSGFTLKNNGHRSAINILLKEYVVTSVWGFYDDYGYVTLPSPNSLQANNEFPIITNQNLKLTRSQFTDPTYYYIEGSYNDMDFKSIKYQFSELLSNVPWGYGLSISQLNFCKPWEKNKIKAYVHRYF